MTWFQAPGVTLPHLVALHGKWRGERTALVDGERRLTWRQFESETARAANGMGVLGLRPGDRVAVLMDNSLEMVILLFGILRYGGVAVPLNVSISDSSVARMIEDADARAVFASDRHCRRIDDLRPQSANVARAARVALNCKDGGWSDFGDWLGAQSPEWHGAVGPDQECNII
jgi:acyl-CoA synthetase (AMP-forming)/AMP-acid ligase II